MDTTLVSINYYQSERGMGLRSVAQCMIVSRAVGMFLVHCEKLGNGFGLSCRGTNPVFENYSSNLQYP